MATLRTAIQLIDGMSSPLRSINNTMNIVINSFETLQSASQNMIDTQSIHAARSELNRAEAALNGVEESIRQANQQQQQFNGSIRTGRTEASGLGSKIMGYVGAFAGMAAIKGGADVTDQYVNQNSRLAMIVDKHNTVEQLQQKIYQAAQRSRGEYSATVDTVAKLGLLTKDAFKGNDETIKFAELMNKSFRVSGASAQEASSGMYQLTQALAAGRLQGDEFRSIMENAPMVAQAIAEYTGKSMGQLKQMSADGEITADIIKNAMFDAADDINGKFETMPMTFGSVWTQIKNKAIMDFSTIMQKVNDTLNSDRGEQAVQGISNAIAVLANVIGSILTVAMVVGGFIADNWGIIEPIVWGIVGAFVAYNAVGMIHNAMLIGQTISALAHGAAITAETAATLGMTQAQLAFNAALMASPITWIILAVVALVVAFYAVIGAINKFAGTSISATGVIAGVFMTAAAFIGNVIIAMINVVIDVFGLLWNHIASFAEFFANVFNDPIGSIVRLFSSMADNVLGVLEGIASAADTLFGSNLADSVAGWRDQLQSMTTDLVGEAKIKVQRIDTSKMHLDRFKYSDAYNAGYKFGSNVESKFDIGSMFNGVNDVTDQLKYAGETASNTGAMKDHMKASEEDLKFLRDIAEQEAINRFTTAEIKIDMTNHNSISGEMDLDGVVAHLEQKVYETMMVAAEGVHN